MVYKHNSERLITSPSVTCFKHEDHGLHLWCEFPKPHLVSTEISLDPPLHYPEPRGIMEGGEALRSWIGRRLPTLQGVGRCSLENEGSNLQRGGSVPGSFPAGWPRRTLPTYSLAPHASAPLARAALHNFPRLFRFPDMALLGISNWNCPVQLRLLNLELKFI